MNFSFSSVYMAVISSNLLLIILTLCFLNKKIMVNAGYKLLALFIAFTLIRFLLPFEFSFTYTLNLPEWISAIIVAIRHPWFYIGTYGVSPWTVLQAIWLSGFAIKLVRYIITQRKARYYILSHMWDVTKNERYQSILSEICREKGKPNHFTIVEVEGIQSPLLYGIRQPHILLPKDYELSDADLYYVFAHEAAHHFHHDLLAKTVIHFIDMIYWWNPFCRILVKQTDGILEMRIDDIVTVSKDRTVNNYIACLLNLADYNPKACPLSLDVCMPLWVIDKPKGYYTKDESIITRRFDMLQKSGEKKNHVLNLVLLLSVLSIYLVSHAFIWEAFYTPPEVEENTLAPSDDSVYAIEREDNTYDIYINGKYMETVDSLEYYPGIKVYTEKEYLNEKP